MTHEVFNQPPPFVGVNLTMTAGPLRERSPADGAEIDAEGLGGVRRTLGHGRRRFDLGRLANENPPRLRSFDRQGRRIDVVEFHPAYHALMTASMARRACTASTWEYGRAENARRAAVRGGARRPAST